MARPWMRGIQGTPQAWQTGSGESDGSAATQIYANPRNLRQRAFSSKSVECERLPTAVLGLWVDSRYGGLFAGLVWFVVAGQCVHGLGKQLKVDQRPSGWRFPGFMVRYRDRWTHCFGKVV